MKSDEDVMEGLLSNTTHTLILNEPSVIHCSPGFDEFVAALKANVSVHTVVVGGLVVQMTPEDKLCQLLEGLGHLKGLERLEVALPHINASARLRAASLTRFLSLAKNLTTLVIWPFLLFSSVQDIQDVADAIRGMSLKQVAWMNLLLSQSFDPILESLASLKHLESLNLAAGCQIVAQPPIGPDALVGLIGNSLTSLSLRNFKLTDEHALLLATRLLQQPKLKFLDLGSNAIGPEGLRSLHDMLEENYVLEWIETDLTTQSQKIGMYKKTFQTSTIDLVEEMKFLLLLNRAGRRILKNKAGTTKGECLDVLSRTEDDVDAIYYLLRQHPFVCSP
jgi:hypothetical protein